MHRRKLQLIYSLSCPQHSQIFGLNLEIPVIFNPYQPELKLSSTISYWNSCDTSNCSFSFIESLMQHVKSPLYYYCKRETSIKHAQLRMNCSKLNYHLFLLHVIDSPVCPCGYDCEDCNHFLFHCPLYHEDRTKLFTNFSLICNSDLTCNLLLFGSADLDLDTNRKIFEIVHSYIESSGRL